MNAPDTLTARAQDIWDNLIPQLQAEYDESLINYNLLERYCALQAETESQGLRVKGKEMLGDKQNPLYTIYQRNQSILSKMMHDLGLSQHAKLRSRRYGYSRVSAAPKPNHNQKKSTERKSKLEQFISGKDEQ